MTARLTSEADIRAAGAAAVQQWRREGWTMPDRQADQVAAVLAPVRDLLDPPRQTAA